MRALHVDRDRRGTVHHQPQRRQVVAGVRTSSGRRRRRTKSDGDEERRRRPVLLDQGEELLGIEAVHEHDVGAEDEHAVAVRQRTRVVQRACHEMRGLGGDARVGEERREHRRATHAHRVRRRRARERAAEDALGSSRRPRRVEHRRPCQWRVERLGRGGGDVGPRPEAGPRSPDANRASAGTTGCGRGPASSGQRASAKSAVAPQIAGDVGDVVRRPSPRHRRAVPAGPHRAAEHGEELGGVPGDQRDATAEGTPRSSRTRVTRPPVSDLPRADAPRRHARPPIIGPIVRTSASSDRLACIASQMASIRRRPPT